MTGESQGGNRLTEVYLVAKMLCVRMYMWLEVCVVRWRLRWLYVTRRRSSSGPSSQQPWLLS